MGKKSDKQRILQFRRDITILRERYTQHVVAEKMDTDSGNLSNYIRGHKNPGEDFLDKFYSIFAAEIKELAGNFNLIYQDPLSVVEEPPQAYSRPDDRDDHIKTLKQNNEDLRSHLGTVIKSNEILALSNQKLVEAQLSLIARLDRSNREVPADE
jgi:hypothetical protein